MTLVLGGTGKTGRRVVERLRACGVPTRAASRSGDRPFDWEDRLTWVPALRGNAKLADGVQRALGREPRDFGDYARRTAATGIWDGGR